MSKIAINMKTQGPAVVTAAELTIPPNVLGVQEWQSASHRLDSQLKNTLERAGIFMTQVEASGGYIGLVISKGKLPAAVKRKIEKNFDAYMDLFDF